VQSKISSEVFNILWPATAGARIEKVRYSLVGSDGLTWEIDYYVGALEGLIVAEVEMASETINPVMPREIKTVFIVDVTNDSAYKNKNLAIKGSPRSSAS
jgi:adenylate cyclase